MQLHFSVKQLGKKRAFIVRESIEIQGEYGEKYTLRNILTQIVKHQVEVFNQKREEKNILNFLKPESAQIQNGKIGFGEVYNSKQANVDKAIETVLQGFEDGIIVVFLDSDQIEDLDSEITITPDSLFTFLRLTFLAGSYW